MSVVNNSSRILGIAFLLQAVTSLSSGMILKLALIVPENMSATMINIANKAWLMRVNILGEMITAMGIVFLGAMLFLHLKKHSERIALVAFGLYILEAMTLIASRMQGFTLLRISQEYNSLGRPASLLTLGNLAFESMNFGYTMLMLPCCVGLILFYYQMFKSGIVPNALSLWGLISAFPMLIGTVMEIMGYKDSIWLYLPYIPFEFAVGSWILFIGLRDGSHVKGNKSIQT